MANAVYLTGVLHPSRAVRVACMGMMFHACVLRACLLFKRELCSLALVLLLLHSSCGMHPLVPVGLLLLVVQLWCWVQAARRIEYVAGHRAGAKGYTGAYVENTIEAMQALIAKDNGPQGPVPDCHFVEVDIQETADGELIILHDFHLADAFPDTGPNVEPYKQLRAQVGPNTPLLIKNVTLAQLHSLHLGGREGLRAPTLRAFMSAFKAAKARRPLVVEVKRLMTDPAREHLIQLLREYQPFAEQLQQLYPQNADPRLGFLALIAFPNHFSTSFGELGGRQWAHWAARLATLGIPVSCCFLESLSYLRGISAATSSP